MMERRTRLKTYSHLGQDRRKPSEYEIVTSRLHYYAEKGFEVDTPIAGWYERYQKRTGLTCKDWDAFVDPRATTYARYTSLQRTQEILVDGLLVAMDSPGYAERVAPGWLDSVAVLASTLRFPYHGLQMAAAYLGQLAPSGRLTILFLFQAADELRKVQRFAYRLAQLRLTAPGAVEEGRRAWREDPRWQPLRRLVEELLVTYDWSEGLVALNLCVKPAMDELFLTGLAERARVQGDPLFAELLASLREDSAWQLSWTRAFAKFLEGASPENADLITRLTARWERRASEALAPLAEDLGRKTA